MSALYLVGKLITVIKQETNIKQTNNEWRTKNDSLLKNTLNDGESSNYEKKQI